MGHTPYGYRIENGIAVIDEKAAGELRKLYENYLSGMSLKKAAAKAGIDTYHGSAKHLLKTKHYIGDDFYPAIIDETVFINAQAELIKRATDLGRLNRAPKETGFKAPTVFTIRDVKRHFSNPIEQAEYIYSLIERGEN
jgi:hypothetical protein